MRSPILQSIRVLLFFTVLLGAAYPGLVTWAGRVLFPWETQGSLMELHGRVIGSRLLAQRTTASEYFRPRPSAAEFSTMPSGASNLGPTSEALRRAAVERKNKGYLDEGLYASASGLDPHISLAFAESQAARVAEARNMKLDELQRWIRSRIEGRDLGFLGEERLNVMELNLELDRQFGK